jgi:hypothetical protein
MEPINKMHKKETPQICVLAYILLLGQTLSVVYAEQLQFPKDLKVSEYFSFFGSGGIDWRALSDPNNNPILVACIEGSTEESLKALGIADLQQRLERLERGNLISKADGRYTLAFPAVVGEKHARLREYAEQAAQKLVPLGEKMIAQIRPHLVGRDEMLYHVLWSVVMDGGPAWDAARAEMNKELKAGDTSIENKAWLLYPSHPFRAGTNSSNSSFGHLRITWSRNTPSPNAIGGVIGQYASQLTEAVEQNSGLTSADARNALGKYGLIDEAGKVRLYTIQSDSEAAAVYINLGTEFGRQMMAYLEVNKVAEILQVSPGIAFVIAYHEICWQLLQELAEKKALAVPRIVAQAGTETSQAYQLVSLVIIPVAKLALLETKMSEQEAQAIDEFRRIKATILAGQSYDDASTPLHAALAHFSTLKPGQTRDYFMGLDILRAPLPPEKPEEGSVWPVFAGDGELADTFVLARSKGRWIWIGNMGNNGDWRPAKSTFEKWAQERIKQVAAPDGSSGQRASETPTPGKSTGNRVLSLDGKDDCVRVADSQSFHSLTNAITIEMWIKASSFYADSGAVNSIIRKNIAPNAENFLLRFRNVAGKPALEMSVGYDIEVLQVAYEFDTGKWYHLAGTYDGSAITVFVNGVTILSQKVSGSLYIDESDLFIGRGDPEFSFGEYLHGALDEIRIWNVARSQKEIQAAMNTTLTGKEQGLVAYWNFDDGTAKDLSPHSNDGILNGDAQIVESPHPGSLLPEQRKPNKLLAWWKFENDANDSAGANHGTIHGSPAYVDGKVGRAISLDGDDYVDCGNPDSLNFGTGDWAISAWIKTTQSGTDPQNRGTVFAKGGDEAGGIRYALAVNQEYLGTIVLTTDDDTYKVQAMGKTAVNDGNWRHVVGMRNADRLRVYVDGALDGETYLPAEFDLSGASQHNAYIGVITDHRDGSLFKYFVGLIDEVCVFACALDANSVRALYSGTDPMKVAGRATPVGPEETIAAEGAPLTGKSNINIATTLILVVGLAGLIGVVVLFLVKSSIRR